MTEQHKCECCEEGYPLYLHGRCHPHAKTWAVLHSSNKLVIECAECGRVVTQFQLEEPK